MSDASEVLGWCLTQAGVNPHHPEDDSNYSILPTASAATSAAPPPVNKVTPSGPKPTAAKKPANEVPLVVETPKEAPIEAAEEAEESPVEAEVENTTIEAATEEQEDEDEVVSTIKNGNNVVAFFCKYIAVVFFV